jgi:outer membrane receptor protein involved in Fe transport
MPTHRTSPQHCPLAILFAALSIWLPAISAVLAQSTGTVRGRVTDKLGAPLPGSTISLKSVSHPEAANRGTVTDARGEYRIVALPPGADYQVSASFPGMATTQKGPISVTSGTLTTLDFILVDELVTTLRVEATGDIVDTTTATATTTIGQEFLASLPILGRSYTDLLTLAPGVTDTDNDGKPNVHGAREVDFQTRLDGANVTDPFSGEESSGINIEAIEEIQVIVSGANAEYGRAQGGLASVTTKSGGNDVEGSFKVFYQSGSLDGDGAHNQDAINLESSTPSFRTLKPFFTVGGPLRKDRAWYFLAAQYIDQQDPVNIIGVTRNETTEGWNNFGKLTWQINPSHKATLYLNHDPRENTGNVLGINISPETDYSVDVSTPVVTAQETWVASPSVLLETTISYLDGRQEVRPLGEVDTNTHIVCLENLECEELSQRFPYSTYNIKFETGQISGPWWVDQDSDSSRFTVKQDLSFYVDDFLGSHQLKAGYEWNAEDYSTTVEQRPLRYQFEGTSGRAGEESILYADFENRLQTGESSADAYAFYLQDAWRLLPNLTLNLGVRVDHERMRAPGQTLFDPAVERAMFNDFASRMFVFQEGESPDSPFWTQSGATFNFEGLACDIAGADLGSPDGLCDNWDIVALTRTLHRHEAENAATEFFTQTPGEEDQFDLPPCGDPRRQGTCRGEEEIDFSNTNIAPRVSISYDPFGTGKTKLYGSWGRFYDRLFLATIIPEQARDFTYVEWAFDTQRQIYSGAVPHNFQIYQVDRELRTPYVDEWTIGVDREISPEFSVSVRYSERQGRNQIQIRDINHRTVDTNPIDGLPDDVRGSEGPSSPPLPDGYADLYSINPFFGGIFRVGNFNTSDYRGLEVHLVKRLHRNWQFDASYTYSEALGNAEAFDDFFLGGDTSQVENEFGYLSYDQRHVVKFSAAAHLPKQIIFGGRVSWDSGLPFSLIRRGFTEDNLYNPTFRTIYPTEQRNDHRNEGRWLIDVNLRKDFHLGRTSAGVEFTVTNLLNSDDLEIQSINDFYNSFQSTAVRRFGRRFQLGFTMNF